MNNYPNTSQGYSSPQGQSYYDAIGDYAQPKPADSGLYVSPYATNNVQPDSDPKTDNFMFKSHDPQVQPYSSFNSTPNIAYNKPTNASNGQAYRPYSASTNTTTTALENPYGNGSFGVNFASMGQQQPSSYNAALSQPLYKELQAHLHSSPHPTPSATVDYNSRHPHMQRGTDAPPNTDTYSSPLFKPTQQARKYDEKPLISLNQANRDETPEGKSFQYQSYLSGEPSSSGLYAADNESRANAAYASYGATPSNTDKYGAGYSPLFKNDSYSSPAVQTRPIGFPGVRSIPNDNNNQNYYDSGNEVSRSYGQIPADERPYVHDPYHQQVENRQIPSDRTWEHQQNNRQHPLEMQTYSSKTEYSPNKTQGQALDSELSRFTLPEPRSGQSKRIFSKEPEAQPSFANPLFNQQPIKQSIMIEDNETMPRIMITEPRDTRRGSDGELRKSYVDVKYSLPAWYAKDKDTELCENLYMIDSVRYSNKKFIGQSPGRGTVGSLRSSQNLRNSQNLRPTVLSPNRVKADNPLNLSQKLDTPRSTRKWDKQIPRVILFVYKYNAAEMEDDFDDDRNTTSKVELGHSSPYYLENHQKAFYAQKDASHHTSTFSLGQSRDVTRLTQKGGEEDDGYFDFEQYKHENKGYLGGKQWDNTDIGNFDESEGLRQTVRVADTRHRSGFKK